MVVEHPGILFILLLVRTINGKIKQKQKAIESINPGATIIPIIISSDKTQITLFRNKTAYPDYMTIGNLPKSIRRKPSRQGQILLAYLPTSRLLHISNKAARRRTQANLFHACMNFILSPSKVAGIQGIEIMSGDGWYAEDIQSLLLMSVITLNNVLLQELSLEIVLDVNVQITCLALTHVNIQTEILTTF